MTPRVTHLLEMYFTTRDDMHYRLCISVTNQTSVTSCFPPNRHVFKCRQGIVQIPHCVVVDVSW